tara:strand:- start:84 stop:539 length:456 start_codon:yes stop_codon:yes gene_type:complete
MIKKIFFKLFLIILLTNCDYTPIYSVNDEDRFNIEITNFEGDREINSKIISKLRVHKNESLELYQISFNTSYSKNIISKNLEGKAEEYQLDAMTSYIIINENFKKNFSVTESFKMKNFEDDFEEKNYEERIKENIADLNYQKIILQIKKIK